MKRLLSLLLALMLILSLAACGDTGNTDAPETTETPAAMAATEAPETTAPEAEEPEEESPAKTEFSVGETWTVDGQWELTVTGITEVQERNQYSDKTPAAVYLIDYVYTNVGYSDASGIMDGLYISMDSNIIDNAGIMGYSYPGNTTYYPQQTPVGASCKAQSCVGVDNSGSFTVNVTQYDGEGKKQAATFVCDPAAEHVDMDVSTSTLSGENALRIGETWTVDGQWELTVTGVTATEDRNEYADKTPAAVYIVDYTYTNIGYEDVNGIMDGLYFSMDNSIVDNASSMGYSYPGDISNYPTQTPVGATCNAQACIGVDNPGSFQIRVSTYDGPGTAQTAVFYIEVG